MSIWDRIRDHRRGLVISCLALVPVFGLALMGGTGLIAYLALHPPTQTTGETPAEWPATNFQEVSFSTADGLSLQGWHIPGTSRQTIILVHGFARDRSELLPEARWLVAQGYSALLFDSRAQGASDGAHVSLGYLEALDVRAAVDFVLNQSPEERIGVLGNSMGAVAAIGAAAQDRRIDAVVAVSPFASLRETMTYRLKGVRPLTDLIAWWGERISGLCLDALRPVDIVGALSPRPVLIIQAEADKMVPQSSGKRLYEAAAEPKELWSVPGISHVGFRQEVPDAYKRRLLGFFRQHLPLDD